MGADRLAVLEICLCLTVVACAAMTFIFWNQSQLLGAGLTAGSLVAAINIVLLRHGYLPFIAAAVILVVDVFFVIHLLTLLATPHGIGHYYYYCTMLGAFFFLGIKGGVLYTGACVAAVFAIYTRDALNSADAMTELLILLISIACTAVIALFYERAVLKRTYVLSDALESMKQLSSTDYLTDIFNRRQFIVNAIQRFEQTGPVTLIALTIDNLGHLKDTHGYAAGDQVLRDIGHVLSIQLKDKALFGRTGDDEFMAMFGATEMTGKARAQELQRAIGNLRYRFNNSDVAVTVSVSVASRGPGDDSFIALMSHVEQAIHKRGKNGALIAGSRQPVL